jgi:hypothetical protein
MIQENVKAQLENIQNAGKKIQAEVSGKVKQAETEGRKLLEKIAGSEIQPETKLSDVVTKIRENNPTFRQLLLNVDAATYDARESLKWNASMMTAYAKLQAEKSIDRDVKPAIESYVAAAEKKLQALKESANQLKAKILN